MQRKAFKLSVHCQWNDFAVTTCTIMDYAICFYVIDIIYVDNLKNQILQLNQGVRDERQRGNLGIILGSPGL
jgi:hypothetical protein